MEQLDLQFEGVSKAELEAYLRSLGADPSHHKIIVPLRTSGDALVDVVVALSKIDLNALSLLIGYALGKGYSMYKVVQDGKQAIQTLAEAKALLEQAGERHAKEKAGGHSR